MRKHSRVPFISLRQLSGLAIAFAVILVGCKDETSLAKIRALESEIETNATSVAKYKQDALRLEAKIDTAVRENAQLKEHASKVEKERGEKANELDELKKAFDAYKAKYKTSMAKRVPGMEVADFTIKGRSYRNVRLTEMTNDEMNFSHAGGLGKVKLTELPETLRDTLGLTTTLVTPQATEKSSQAPTWKQQYERVSDAREGQRIVRAEMDALIRKQEEAKLILGDLLLTSKDARAMKKAVEDIENAISKLKSRQAAADLAVLQEETILSTLRRP